MPNIVDQAFQSLFYGAGSWLGILILLTISLALLLKWKYSAPILMVVMLSFGIDYLDQSLPWHATIMFFSVIFSFAYLVKEVKK